MAEALREREGKLSVFISYSRDDLDFADQLEATLSLAGFAPTLDRTGIYGAEEWKEKLYALIRDAEAIIFVLSPSSASSKVCAWEVDTAVSLGKRIIPVVCKPIEGTAPPQQLSELNYIYFYHEARKPGAGFPAGLRELADALKDIPEWMREHTRLLRLASDWEAAGRPTNRLLSGSDVAKAKDWIAQRPTGQLPPSELQLDYIRASEEAEAIRQSAEHQRLKEMEAVQNAREAAIKDKEAAQKQRDAEARAKVWRTYGWAATGVAAAAAVAAVVYFTGKEREQRIEAVSNQNQLAARLTFRSDQAVKDADPATGLLLALEALPDSGSKDLEERDRPNWPDAIPALENAGRKLRELAVFAGHSEGVTSVAVTPSGSHIISASLDNTVRIWDVASRKSSVLLGHTAKVTSLAVAGTRVVTGSEDKTIRVWDIASGKLAVGPMGDASSIVDVAVVQSRDGDRIISASTDRTIHFWDLQTGASTAHEIKIPDRVHPTSMAVSPDGTQIVIGAYDDTARVIDLKTGREVAQLRGHTDTVSSVAFAAARIVTGSFDGSIRIWEPRYVAGRELPEWRKTTEMNGHTGPISRVTVTDDGARVISAGGSGDNSLRIWDAETGREIAVVKGHMGAVQSVAVTRDGMRVVSGSTDNTVRLWDATTTVELKGHKGPIYGIAVSPDGEHIVTVAWNDPNSRDRSLARVWSAKTGSEKVAFKEHQADINAVAVMSDNVHVVTGSDDTTARIWNLRTGDETKILRGHTNFVMGVAVSSDGKMIVTGSADNTARVWDLATDRTLAVLSGHSGSVQSVAFAPGDRHIVTGSADKTARIWKLTSPESPDLGQWEMIWQLEGHERAVSSVAVTQDNRVVTGSHDDTARIWDLATGKPIGEPLKGHSDSVLSVAATADGSYIVTGSADMTARIWNSKTGKEVAQLKGHTNAVTSVAVPAVGKRVVTGSLDRTARTWNLASTKEAWDISSSLGLVQLAKRSSPRCLTPVERLNHGLSEKPPGWCGELDKWPYDPVGGLIEGTRLLGIGNPRLAEVLFKAVEHHPEAGRQISEARAVGHLRYGIALLNEKRDDDANEQFKLAERQDLRIKAKVDLAWATAYIDRGKKLLTAGAEKAGTTQFELALERDPSSAKRTNEQWADAYITLGATRLREGKDDQANAHFSRARGLDPNTSNRIATTRADAHYERGKDLLKKNDDEGAQSQFDMAMKIEPSDFMRARVHNVIAWQWFLRQQPEKGERDAEAAVKLRPDDGYIRDTRGQIYLAMDRIDEALVDFDHAINRGFLDAGTFYGRGLCHEKKGNIEAAKADYRRSRELRAIDDEAQRAQRKAVERLRALDEVVSDRSTTPQRQPGP